MNFLLPLAPRTLDCSIIVTARGSDVLLPLSTDSVCILSRLRLPSSNSTRPDFYGLSVSRKFKDLRQRMARRRSLSSPLFPPDSLPPSFHLPHTCMPPGQDPFSQTLRDQPVVVVCCREVGRGAQKKLLAAAEFAEMSYVQLSLGWLNHLW